MSEPAERNQRIIDEITAGYDLTHDFGRKQAYEALIDHARRNLLNDPHVDDFLAAAADRLGFAPVRFDTIESRVVLPKGAWLDLWISDSDEEVALTGTAEGLQYLIDLLTQLKSSTDPEEHIHLDRSYLPMTETSANLVLFREEERWFTGVPEEGWDPYPQREISPESIYAIQFLHFPPDDLPITVNRLYRVVRVEDAAPEASDVKDLPEAVADRYRRFTFIADNREPFRYTFHLDDPGVNYFTHREIVSLALKPVQ